MQLTANNSGLYNNLANASLNTNLPNSLSNGLFNQTTTSSGLFDQTSLWRASAYNTTTSGKTISVIGSGNTLNAQEGDASLGVVGDNNALNGGSGNDNLRAVGGGNTLTGGLGNDTLIATGNNILIGGEGSDTFVLPSINLSSSGNTLQQQSLIQDFQLGLDKLQLPTTISTATGSTSSFRVVDFNELTLTTNGQNTYISYQGNPLAELQNISTSQLQATDFVQPNITGQVSISISA